MDFIERLAERVNEIKGLPIKCKLGYLSTDEDLKLYPIAGGRVTSTFYDGVKEQQLNYEFVGKSSDQQKVSSMLWLIQNTLEELSELTSSDGSFDFDSIYITNKPYINAIDEDRNYIFQLNVQANLTTYSTKEEITK